MSFAADLRPWIDPEEVLEPFEGEGDDINEDIFDPDEDCLADYLEAHVNG